MEQTTSGPAQASFLRAHSVQCVTSVTQHRRLVRTAFVRRVIAYLAKTVASLDVHPQLFKVCVITHSSRRTLRSQRL